MGVDLLIKEDIVLGSRVEVIALCSKVEVKQNFTTTGGFREVYHLNGKHGAFVSGVIFKLTGAPEVDIEVFTDAPVLVRGTIGEYRDVKQIHIESITPLTETLDKNDLLAEMVDTKVIDVINDILYEQQSMYTLSFQHLRPADGLEDSGAGTYTERLLKLLHIGRIAYPELTKEYVSSISVLSNYFLNTEGTLDDRFDVIKQIDSSLLRALLFSARDYPDYEEFVKLHHLIMKPRGCVLEILDSVFTNHPGSGGAIQQQ